MRESYKLQSKYTAGDVQHHSTALHQKSVSTFPLAQYKLGKVGNTSSCVDRGYESDVFWRRTDQNVH